MLEIKENETFSALTLSLVDGDKVIDEITVDKTIFQDYFNKDALLSECLGNQSFKKLRTRVKAVNKTKFAVELFGNMNPMILEEISNLKRDFK